LANSISGIHKSKFICSAGLGGRGAYCTATVISEFFLILSGSLFTFAALPHRVTLYTLAALPYFSKGPGGGALLLIFKPIYFISVTIQYTPPPVLTRNINRCHHLRCKIYCLVLA
jgi:hypothetical protein